jgi:putative GTP pyrophosphokinase
MSILETKLLEFKHDYDAGLDFNNSALTFFINLISKVRDVQSISGRVKDYDECLSKFERKYLPDISTEDSDYHIIDFLSDFIGIRVVCFYLADVNNIRKQLSKHFSEVSISDKTVQLEKSDDKFGYKSLHLNLKIKSNNKSTAYKKYADVPFEIQIRTIIQDAWSVLDHKIKYKKSIPHKLKRRINRLSALFEIADDEFLRIKKEITLEESRIIARIKKGDTIDKETPLDVFRFLFIALKYFPEYKFVEFKVDGFVREILDLNQYFSESDLNDVLSANLDFVDHFLSKIEKMELTPYTKIRYCLYISNDEIFSAILTAYQKENIMKK